MKTRTIPFETKLYFVEVEVMRDGSIRSATEYSYALADHIDCLERIKNSHFWLDKIEREYQKIDWEDKGEDTLSEAQDWMMDKISERLLG